MCRVQGKLYRSIKQFSLHAFLSEILRKKYYFHQKMQHKHCSKKHVLKYSIVRAHAIHCLKPRKSKYMYCPGKMYMLSILGMCAVWSGLYGLHVSKGEWIYFKGSNSVPFIFASLFSRSQLFNERISSSAGVSS